MDSATTIKCSKPSSNISDIVQRFAKVCKLRSVGVFPSENPNPSYQTISNKNDSNDVRSDGTEDTECSDQKIHPQPIEEALIKTHEDLSSIAVLKLFDTISSLKFAYIQLQEAHIPYNPQGIQAADDRIVTELKTLSDIKKSFKSITKPKSSSSFSGPIMVQKLQDHESYLVKLQSQIQVKDSEILNLQKEVQGLERKNKVLDSKIKQKALLEKSYRPKSFSDAYKSATKSIHDFAKPLISLMKASGWNLDLAVNSIEDSIKYSKRSHKKYAFEAYLSRRMFHGLPLDSHNVDDILRFEDPFDALVEYPNSEFAKFCRSKYLMIVHSRMEKAFFGNVEQRAFVSSIGHPRTPLYQAFVKMAKSVWVLHAMATSKDYKAEIFRVEKGTEFSELYMENVVEDIDDTSKLISNPRLRVGFMIMPGFRVGQIVIRSKVYLTS